MIEGGEDPRFIARRMIVLASEDIGNADPQALPIAVAAAHAVEHVGFPEAEFALAQAAIYLSLAPKSDAVKRAIGEVRGHIREHGTKPPPAPLRSAAYPAARKLGRGKGYDYPHGHPGHVNDQEHLPEGLEGLRFYFPDEGEPEPRAARGRSARRAGATRGRPLAGSVPARWQPAPRRPAALGRSCPPRGGARYLRRAATAILDELDPLADALADSVGQPRTEAVLAELLPSVGGLHDLADDGPRALRDRRLGPHPRAARRAPLGAHVGAARRRSASAAAAPRRGPSRCSRRRRAAGGQRRGALAPLGERVRAAFERGGVPPELIARRGARTRTSARAARARRRHAPAAREGHDARARRRAARPHRHRRAVGGVRRRRPPPRRGRPARRRARGGRAADRRARGGRAAAAPRRPAPPPTPRSARCARAETRARVEELVAAAVADGATLLCGGPLEVPDVDGRLLRPRGAARRAARTRGCCASRARPGAGRRRGGERGARRSRSPPAAPAVSVWTGDRGARRARRRARSRPRSRGSTSTATRSPSAAVRLAGHVEARRLASQPTRLRSARWLPYDPRSCAPRPPSARLMARPRDRAPRRAARRRAAARPHRRPAGARGARAARPDPAAAPRRRAQPLGQQRHDARAACTPPRRAARRSGRDPTRGRSRGGCRPGSRPTVIWLASSSSGRTCSGTGGRMTISIASSRACGVMCRSPLSSMPRM